MMLRRKSLGYKAMQLLKEIVPEETMATKAKKKQHKSGMQPHC